MNLLGASSLLILARVPQLRSPRIWGTFSASGGAGASTLTVHLARVAARSSLKVLVIESALTAPLREILRAHPPYWEEYQSNLPDRFEAFPQQLGAGFSLLTRRSPAPIPAELFEEVIASTAEYFDLVIADQPHTLLGEVNSILVAENSLPSLIGMQALNGIHLFEITVINKFSPKIKRRPVILGFIRDSETFILPRSKDLELVLGFNITRTLTRVHEKKLREILARMAT
jgi:cellulose biosynthesis protein BcsQ